MAKVKPHPITFIQSETSRINPILKQLEDIMTGKENKPTKMKPIKALKAQNGSQVSKVKDSERMIGRINRTSKLKTSNTPRKYSEHKLQVECVKWFRYNYPNHILFSIPNERKASPMAGKRLKDSGRLAGIPDLFLACDKVDSDVKLGLFIEMKSEKGVLTTDQIFMHAKLELFGYKAVVCRSFDEFKNVVNEYLK